MKKNGFITSALLYGMLALFLVLMLGSLAILSNRKLSMDKLKQASIADTKVKEAEIEEPKLAYDYINQYVSYNNGGYIYRGNNPNNYITFNGEEAGWRIISVEPDHSIKIMKNDSIVSSAYNGMANEISWTDENNISNYLNTTYYDSLTGKTFMTPHNFNVGSVKGDENSLDDIKVFEQDTTWNGLIGLISISDYFNSNSEEKCRNFDSDSAECASSTYINRTMTVTTNGEDVYIISDSGYNLQSVTEPSDVKPVIYLKSGTIIERGTGTSDDPYQLSAQ